MLIIASRKRCHIESVPITTIYSDEVSSIHPVRDTLRFFITRESRMRFIP